MESDGLSAFQAHRPRLYALAYRMLGSAAEAEDAVQETYLRWESADRAAIGSAEAWLTTVLANLCRTWLVSARTRRESYVGVWLPEPVPTSGGELGPLETAEERELVSLALLAAMERLNPVERAVFVLREAFGYAHREIADMLSLTEANSQQTYRRASQRVRDGKSRFTVPPAQATALIERFLEAARNGDVEKLESVLAADVIAVADGGGKVNAARRPVHGAGKVARYLVGLWRWAVPEMDFAIEEFNGAPGLVVRVGGAPLIVIAYELADDAVSALYLVVNPDKLARLARAGESGFG
ncbi:RNA polymerase sigma-70 factor [Nocardia puris]|uniref:RNA polymerase ECF family sigma subunit n=1 Tax=Nocardia puris TaxID=208602 RepID=A0A366DCI4_9NOCA|nr:RNA polymerase sigma-70 factor [Nocardia puris]RBO87770.1 RNA polymerase ECF family sigma subunit [Nocardia puris]